MAADWGEAVARAVVGAWRTLPKNGKPQPHEYTCLAAILSSRSVVESANTFLVNNLGPIAVFPGCPPLSSLPEVHYSLFSTSAPLLPSSQPRLRGNGQVSGPEWPHQGPSPRALFSLHYEQDSARQIRGQRNPNLRTPPSLTIISLASFFPFMFLFFFFRSRQFSCCCPC